MVFDGESWSLLEVCPLICFLFIFLKPFLTPRMFKHTPLALLLLHVSFGI